MIALSVGGLALALLYPMLAGSAEATKRARAITSGKDRALPKPGLRARLLAEDPKDSRRKQLQESLKQIEEREKQRKQKLTLRLLINQAGLDITPRLFYTLSLAIGGLIAGALLILGTPWYLAAVAFIAGALGLPRWALRYLRRRRQNQFLDGFADAVDVMVRGLKAGLPVTDAMKVISTESAPPVGPEFLEVVEGQRIGITMDQGIDRMFDRMPLAEVNFLGIVMAIQQKTGGNLAEALNNLSKVLRDRKKMKAKIRAVSQEAKASAAIIGSLPFLIMGAMMVLNPAYLNPLFDTKVGNLMLVGSGLWMLTGVLIMKKMINFDF
ncbi:MAG: type II secretion system F family protein [Rhizobiales bacterium]|nr:type II secretion system F family protein [Hyphomicrobiales bacterium]